MTMQQKRSAAEAECLLVGVKAIFFDIEGTTTPITFVADKFCPRIREDLEKYLTEKFEDPEAIKAVCALRELAQKDKKEGVEGVVEIPDCHENKDDVVKAVAANVKWQMDNKRKSAELAQIQGHVCKMSFESGQLEGEVFEDVAPMLRMLSDEGFLLYIFSSASVESQKLLFQYTNCKERNRDLREFITDFFDTSVGSKTDTETYKTLAAKIECRCGEILFLTDCPEEAEAAVSAGWRSALVIRPGNPDLTDDHLQNFACIEQFDELYGDEDEEDVKRLHADDNGEAEDDDDDEVDEDEEGEEDEDGEGDGDDA